MKDNDFLILIIIGLGVWWITSNSNPGPFSPNAPFPGEQYLSDIIPMNVSSAGRAFIKRQEGYTQFPKADAHGTQEVGYGHQILPGEDFSAGLSRLEASQLLDTDLVPREDAINNSVLVPINQNQFDALADFVYNVGIGAFKNSTLLRLLNSGDYSGAAAQFTQWANQNRRLADQQLFTSAA